MQLLSQADAIAALSHEVMRKDTEDIEKVSGTSLRTKLAEYRGARKAFPRILDRAEMLVKFYCGMIGVDGDHLA